MATKESTPKCPNLLCKCPDCTCGDGCTCNISMEVACDPCNEFKASMMAVNAAESTTSAASGGTSAFGEGVGLGTTTSEDSTLNAVPIPEAFQAAEFNELNLKFTDMGVIIINSDGTMSKIPNWKELSNNEQVKAVRLIAKRNKRRKEALLDAAEEREQGITTCIQEGEREEDGSNTAKSAEDSSEVLTIEDARAGDGDRDGPIA